MQIQALLIFLLVGGVAGWLASLIVRGGGMGLIGNIIVGVIGAFIAGWLFPRFGLRIGGPVVGAILHATLGAVILLFLIRLIKKV
ncbi:MAG: GlsB/YeaQ/YmgE family stress response membrane protein [Beijerinckiaceae bacterium]